MPANFHAHKNLHDVINSVSKISCSRDIKVTFVGEGILFDDCVRIAHAEGIEAYIQPGGSVRDKDSIAYCKENGLAMVMTQLRHFKH